LPQLGRWHLCTPPTMSSLPESPHRKHWGHIKEAGERGVRGVDKGRRIVLDGQVAGEVKWM
jgi:hypothetical protein